MPGFQTSVGLQPAPAVEGDFCDVNPRATVNAGPGGLVAGLNGLTVGRFAWLSYEAADADNAPAVANPYGGGLPAGFVHREQQGLITTFLQEAGMTIPVGFPVTLHSAGGFWVRNAGATPALVGMKAYANMKDGTVSFKATGTQGTTTLTGSIGPVATTSFTGSIAGNILSVSAITAGAIVPGATVSGTGGGGVATGTKVARQLTGTTGGVGTYAVTVPEQTVTSTAMSAAAGLLTVSTITGTPLSVGDVLSGTGGGGVTAGSVISALGTGAGGTGTYYVDPSQTVAVGTVITVTQDIETKWIAASAGAAGELVKMTSWPLG